MGSDVKRTNRFWFSRRTNSKLNVSTPTPPAPSALPLAGSPHDTLRAKTEELRARFGLVLLKVQDMTVGRSAYAPRRKVDVVATIDHMNVFGSRLDNGNHVPLFDFDFPVELVPSSTPGHFHLYVSKEIGWEHYRDILLAMRRARLLDAGWVDSALEERCATIRPPHVMKEEALQKQLEYLDTI